MAMLSVLLLPLRAIEPVMPFNGIVRPANGVHDDVLPAAVATLNE